MYEGADSLISKRSGRRNQRYRRQENLSRRGNKRLTRKRKANLWSNIFDGETSSACSYDQIKVVLSVTPLLYSSLDLYDTVRNDLNKRGMPLAASIRREGFYEYIAGLISGWVFGGSIRDDEDSWFEPGVAHYGKSRLRASTRPHSTGRLRSRSGRENCTSGVKWPPKRAAFRALNTRATNPTAG